MTRKAVLLALLFLLVAVGEVRSRIPVKAQEYKGPFYPISLTHEREVWDNDQYFPATPPFTPLSSPSPSVSSVNPSSMPTIRDAKDWAKAKLGPAEYLCLDSIFRRESGWRTLALNKSSGAYGIPQALPGSKMAWAGSDWRTNPLTQVRWGIHYVNARYGSACDAWAFWQRVHWY